MLAHPTHERLIALGLTGMAKAFEDQRRSQDIATLSFEERLGLMVDREAAERDTKRLATRLKFAALRQNAVVEDIDLRAPRGIDRALFQKLIAGDWINRAEGLLITGPTGVGKSWIACALGHNQQGWNDEADAFAGTGRGETQNVLGPVMAEIVALQPSEHDTVRAKEACPLHFLPAGPTGRTIGLGILRLTGAPDRHADGHDDR